MSANGGEPTSDVELSTIQQVVRALDALSPESRSRALAYIIGRFGDVEGRRHPTARLGVPAPWPAASFSHADGALDIRSFREAKQPANGQEMAALVAYYLAAVVDESIRREEISGTDIDKYFKQAGFPLPARPRAVLWSAKNSGFLEETSERGCYRLSPVGYNLVAHGLPRSAKSRLSRGVSAARSNQRVSAPSTPSLSSGLEEE